MSDTKQPNIWEELRKPFPKEVMGLLPKISCYNCTNSQTKVCGSHHKDKCAECGNYLTTAHIHLDFVGHAAVTDRLNNVAGPDSWNWEPLAHDEYGLPRLDSKGNLWIKLTIHGVTRLGYGDGSSSIKELIGDALRNAAMRFGIALDLWSKDELESTLENPELKNDKPSAKRAPEPPQQPTTPPRKAGLISDKQLGKVMALFNELGMTDRDAVLEYTSDAVGRTVASRAELTLAEARKLIDALIAEIEEQGGAV